MAAANSKDHGPRHRDISLTSNHFEHVFKTDGSYVLTEHSIFLTEHDHKMCYVVILVLHDTVARSGGSSSCRPQKEHNTTTDMVTNTILQRPAEGVQQ